MSLRCRGSCGCAFRKGQRRPCGQAVEDVAVDVRPVGPADDEEFRMNSYLTKVSGVPQRLEDATELTVRDSARHETALRP